MLKEILPIDLFDTASESYPPDNVRSDTDLSEFTWDQVAGAVYGAMKRGHNARDIWRELSWEFVDATMGGCMEQKKYAEKLAPYIARLVISVNNLLVQDDGKISMEQLKTASASLAVGKLLP